MPPSHAERSLQDIVALYTECLAASAMLAQLPRWRVVRRSERRAEARELYLLYRVKLEAWVRMNAGEEYVSLRGVPPEMSRDLLDAMGRLGRQNVAAQRQKVKDDAYREHRAWLEQHAKPEPDEIAGLEAAKRFTWEK